MGWIQEPFHETEDEGPTSLRGNSSDILYRYPFLEVLTGVDDGVVALVDEAHAGHVGHSVRGDVGAGNVCVPDPELLHLAGEGDVQVPLLRGRRQPGLIQIQFANITL